MNQIKEDKKFDQQARIFIAHGSTDIPSDEKKVIINLNYLEI